MVVAWRFPTNVRAIQNPEQTHGDNKIHGVYLSEQGSSGAGRDD
jgi:hypothetical protein